MDLGIHQMNVIYWETLVLGMLKSRPAKDRGHDPVQRNKFNRQQENNDIVASEVDEILLHENEKVSADKEAHENIESDFDEIKFY